MLTVEDALIVTPLNLVTHEQRLEQLRRRARESVRDPDMSDRDRERLQGEIARLEAMVSALPERERHLLAGARSDDTSVQAGIRRQVAALKVGIDIPEEEEPPAAVQEARAAHAAARSLFEANAGYLREVREEAERELAAVAAERSEALVMGNESALRELRERATTAQGRLDDARDSYAGMEGRVRTTSAQVVTAYDHWRQARALRVARAGFEMVRRAVALEEEAARFRQAARLLSNGLLADWRCLPVAQQPILPLRMADSTRIRLLDVDATLREIDRRLGLLATGAQP